MSDLRSELLRVAHARNMENNPFVSKLVRGEYPREILRDYALRLAQSAARGPMILGVVLGYCPHTFIRAHLLENLIEEEGIVFDVDARRFRSIASRRHTEMIRRFTRALGIPDEVIPPVGNPKQSDWLGTTFREGRWLALLGYITIGIEANVPRTFRLIAPALRRHYGFSDDDIVFFREHIVADSEHGAIGVDMVTSVVKTPADYAEAMAGVSRGAKTWWWLHQLSDITYRRKNAQDISRHVVEAS